MRLIPSETMTLQILIQFIASYLSILLLLNCVSFVASSETSNDTTPRISKPRTATFFTNVAVFLTWNVTIPSDYQVSYRINFQEAQTIRKSEDGREIIDEWRPEIVLPNIVMSQAVFLTERDGIQAGSIYKFQVIMLNQSTDLEVVRSVWSKEISLTHVGVISPVILMAAPTSNETIFIQWRYIDQSSFPLSNFSILIRPEVNSTAPSVNKLLSGFKTSPSESTSKKSKYGKYRNITLAANLDYNNTQSSIIRLVDRAPSYQIVVLGQIWDNNRQKLKFTRKSENYIMTAATLSDTSKYYPSEKKNKSKEVDREEVPDMKEWSQKQLIIIISISGGVTLLILCVLIIILACRMRSGSRQDGSKTNGKNRARGSATGKTDAGDAMMMQPLDYDMLQMPIHDDPSKSIHRHVGDYPPMKRDDNTMEVNEMSKLTGVPFHQPGRFASESNNNLYQNEYCNDQYSPSYSNLPYPGSPSQSSMYMPPASLRSFHTGDELAYLSTQPTHPLPNGRDGLRNISS